MSSNIVTVNVSVSKAPAPSILQQTGAIISQGATSLASGTYQILEEAADLTALLVAARSITSALWSSGTLTVTAAAALPAHLATGSKFVTTLAGFTPAGVNGQYLATVTGANTFTIAIAVDPGSVTVEGTYSFTDELVSQVNSFFGQGSSTSVYVLELGEGTTAAGVTALAAFIAANSPQAFYSYLLPRGWDSESTLPAFLAGFETTTSKTYFFITTTTSTYSNYTALMKCVVALVESPTKPVSEFTLAAAFQITLHYNPSGSNRVPKLCFSFLFGVTAYPTVGNSVLLAALKAANINYVGTAAEGGLTNTMLLWGTTADGEDFTWWYSVDWAQINIDQNLSNVIINGSNNPTNPLYFNQAGINRLQDAAVATFNTAITAGLALGPCIRTSLTPDAFTQALDDEQFLGEMVVNAVPFLDYTKANPSDFGIGKYAGLSGQYIPNQGFKQIIFNIDVTDIV